MQQELQLPSLCIAALADMIMKLMILIVKYLLIILVVIGVRVMIISLCYIHQDTQIMCMVHVDSVKISFSLSCFAVFRQFSYGP